MVIEQGSFSQAVRTHIDVYDFAQHQGVVTRRVSGYPVMLVMQWIIKLARSIPLEMKITR